MTVVASAGAASLPAIELIVERRVVPYQTDARFRGHIPGVGAGETVALQVKECGQAWRPLTRTQTSAGGGWIADATMWFTSSVRATWKGSRSPTVTIGVVPRVFLTQLGRAWKVEVVARQYFRGTRVRIERFNRSRSRWQLAKRVPLRGEGGVSTGTVEINVPAGTRLRAVLPKPNACYLRAVTAAVVAR